MIGIHIADRVLRDVCVATLSQTLPSIYNPFEPSLYQGELQSLGKVRTECNCT